MSESCARRFCIYEWIKMKALKLSAEQYGDFFDQVLHPELGLTYKVEKPIKKEFADVEAIRVYVPELMKNINSCVERNERPILLVKSYIREKTGKPEITMVFYGSAKDRHVENFSYFVKNPEEWKSWGEIILTVEQAKRMVTFLQKLIESIGSSQFKN